MKNQKSAEITSIQNIFEKEKKDFSIIILKLASRCNLACTYCHWFRDKDVYELAPLLNDELLEKFFIQLEEYLNKINKQTISIIFHGGEPLLIKKKRFDYICHKLKEIELTTKKKINLGITTNATLIDEEWALIFKKHYVGVSVSLDGDKKIHDLYRIDLKGKGTYDKVIDKIKILQKIGVKISVLSVCQPDTNPEILYDLLFDKLGIKTFDILIPNYNHVDKKNKKVQSISKYYILLFDLWLNKYYRLGARIRIIEAFVNAVLQIRTKTPGIGFCPLKIVCINSSGDIEPHDVLRINGSKEVKTGLNLKNNNIMDILNNKLWLETLENSITLPNACQDCSYKKICNGGNVIHRFSEDNTYDNKSVYCEDLQNIYQHIIKKTPEILLILNE